MSDSEANKKVIRLMLSVLAVAGAAALIAVNSVAVKRREQAFENYKSTYIQPIAEKYAVPCDNIANGKRLLNEMRSLDNGGRLVGELEFSLPENTKQDFMVAYRGDYSNDSPRYTASDGRDYVVQLDCVIHKDGTKSYTYFINTAVAGVNPICIDLCGTTYSYPDYTEEDDKEIAESLRPVLTEIKKEFDNEVFGIKEI